jgi:hypothetical protein
LKCIPREVIFSDGCKLIISEFDKSFVSSLLDDRDVSKITEEIIELPVGDI